MQILLLGIGVVLIGVGLAFAVAGVGLDRAQGGARGGTLEAPAWLFLVVIGVGLVVFAATRDWNGDVSVTPTSSTTTTSLASQAPTTTERP